MSENKKTQKLTLSRETLRTLDVKTAMKAGRPPIPTHTCHCGSVQICDSIDLCEATKGPACPAPGGQW